MDFLQPPQSLPSIRLLKNLQPYEPLAKFTFAQNCHSERSEESRIYKGLRSFTSFRMTKPTLLQEPQMSLQNQP